MNLDALPPKMARLIGKDSKTQLPSDYLTGMSLICLRLKRCLDDLGAEGLDGLLLSVQEDTREKLLTLLRERSYVTWQEYWQWAIDHYGCDSQEAVEVRRECIDNPPLAAAEFDQRAVPFFAIGHNAEGVRLRTMVVLLFEMYTLVYDNKGKFDVPFQFRNCFGFEVAETGNFQRESRLQVF